MEMTQILAFAGMVALLVMSPGPNGLLIARTVPSASRMAGFAAIAGFVVAFFLHSTLSILGISALLMASSTAFGIVRLAGAAYLIWLGIKALRAAWRGTVAPAGPAPAQRRTTLRRSFAEGFLTNALNPKVSMFYLAAFPQVIAASHAGIGSVYLLVVLHALINVIWFCWIVLMFDRLGRLTRSARFRRWLQGLTGIAFIGFGARLATLRQG